LQDRVAQRAKGAATVGPAIVEGEARGLDRGLLPDALVGANVYDGAVVDADLPLTLALRQIGPSRVNKAYLLERVAAC